MNEQQRNALIEAKRAIEEILSQDEQKKKYRLLEFVLMGAYHAIPIVDGELMREAHFINSEHGEPRNRARRIMSSMGYTEIPPPSDKQQISIDCCGCRNVRTETCNRCYVAYPHAENENLFEIEAT